MIRFHCDRPLISLQEVIGPFLNTHAFCTSSFQMVSLVFKFGMVMTYVFVAACSGKDVVAEEEAELRSRAIAGWRTLEKATRVTNCERVYFFPSAKGTSSRKQKLAVQSTLQKQETVSDKGTKAFLVYGDMEYALTMSSSGSWQLENVAPSKPSTDRSVYDIRQISKAAFSIMNVSLLDAISDKNFRFSGWRNVDGGLVEFEVVNLEEQRLNLSKIEHPVAPFERIKIRVDPSNNYRIANFEHRHQVLAQTYLVTAECTYELDPYFPTTLKQVNELDGRQSEWGWKCSKISHQPLPESEFTLAHYGLASAMPKPTRWPLWWLGAILLAVIAVLSRRFLRDRA